MVKKASLSAPESYVSIFVKELTVQVRLGFLDHEKIKSQPLKVSVELFADAASYFQEISADNIIDYRFVYEAIKSWEAREQVDFIESYVRELLEIVFEHSMVEAAKISVGKPDVFDEAQEAGVEVFMRRADFEAL